MGAPTVAWMNGQIVAFAAAAVPIEDRGLQFGESLYEVVIVTSGGPRLLAEHAARMQAAAEVLTIAAGVPELDGWAAISAALIERDPIDEGLLIAQVTGGVAARSHLPEPPPKPSFFAYLRPFRFPRRAAVAHGIQAITLPDNRWARCDLKTTMLLPGVLARREAAIAGAGEVILLGDGERVHEGAASNVILVEGERLITPELTEHLLPGITGPLVGVHARAARLEMSAEPVDRARLMAADEVFVTSSTFLVMPVVAIDDRPIGDGVAGPVAIDLARRVRVGFELPAA